MEWVDPRFHIAGYSDDKFRIVGGKLNGLEVHDIHKPNGKRLVWYNEMGTISTSPVLGFMKVRFADLINISSHIAKIAKRTNSDDVEEELVQPGPDPEYVWLGVQRHRQIKGTADDPCLPIWALGVEIIEEAHFPGDFAPLGYTTPGGEKYYEAMSLDYCTVLEITP